MEIFISHASEDKDNVARPLAVELEKRGYRVWFDEFSLNVGDGLVNSINSGLASCPYGLIVLSKNFFNKKWTNYEIETLYNLKMAKGNRHILPVWHDVTHEEVTDFHPHLGGLLATSLNRGLDRAVDEICRSIDKTMVANKTSYRSPATNIAGVNVIDMPLVEVFKHSLSIADVPCSYDPHASLPQELKDYYIKNIDDRIEYLRNVKRKSVTNGNGYGLKSINIDKGQLSSGGRYHWPNLVFEPAEYFHQVMFSERLDDKKLITIKGQEKSIREYSGIDFSSFSWGDVERIPFPQRFANVVGLVVPYKKTQPDKKCLIIAIRSDQTFVSEDGDEFWQASMSCAEGMLRPDDAGMNENKPPTPFNTAARSLEQELGVSSSMYSETIKMVALGYDSRRCQPVAVFSLETNDIDFDDVFKLWQRAEDRNENRDILPIPINHKELNLLINSNYLYKDKPLKLFSNHQLLGACVICELYGKSNIT